MFENQGNVWNKNQSPAWKDCIGCTFHNTHFTTTNGFARELWFVRVLTSEMASKCLKLKWNCELHSSCFIAAKIFTSSLWSVRVRTMENCCLFAEIFNILYQQRFWTSHLKQKETAEIKTNFRSINRILNSLLPFLEIASTSLRSEYVTYAGVSIKNWSSQQIWIE